MELFGRTIRMRRQERMSRRQFAERLGIPFGDVIEIERNKMIPTSRRLVHKMAEILDLDEADLLAKAGLPAGVVCEECGREFKSERGLKIHMSAKH